MFFVLSSSAWVRVDRRRGLPVGHRGAVLVFWIIGFLVLEPLIDLG